MFKNPFRCRICEAKDKEIEHLHALVNSLLMAKGVAPVVTQAEMIVEESEEEKRQKELEKKGAVIYGEG